MQILLVSATEKEINNRPGYTRQADILISGVGYASTLYFLQKKLSQKKYDLVIQMGISGSFTKNFYPGKVVLVNADTFGDIGTEENGKFSPIFESELADKNTFPYQNGWLKNDTDFLQQFSLEKVNAITINKISDSALQKKQLAEQFNPTIESMEGAALHYVCLQEKISFLQIRGISNYVGDRNKNNWRIKEAIDNLNREVAKILSLEYKILNVK